MRNYWVYNSSNLVLQTIIISIHRTGPSIWRDMKVISNTAYIVAEALNHGLQVFDLLRLRDMTPSSEVPEVTSDADYSLFGNAHNIVSNEETGYVYVVGATQKQYPLGCRGEATSSNQGGVSKRLTSS